MSKQIHNYGSNMVCATPGEGLTIQYMPDFLDADPANNFVPHVHTFYEILWFRKAGGMHMVDFCSYPIEENTLFFLSPGQIHHFETDTRPEGVTLKFCADFLHDNEVGTGVFLKYNVFNAFDTVPYCTVDSSTAFVLEDLLHRMEKEQQMNGSFGHVEVLHSLVNLFLVILHRHGRKKVFLPLQEAKASHRLFVLFRKQVEEDYDTMHSVAEYAQRLNVSTKTLSNSVRECSNKSPLEFINDRIILEAKRMLRFTNLMGKEIADQLGFEDNSYFVKFFKRQTGFLPSEFREGDRI